MLSNTHLSEGEDALWNFGVYAEVQFYEQHISMWTKNVNVDSSTLQFTVCNNDKAMVPGIC